MAYRIDYVVGSGVWQAKEYDYADSIDKALALVKKFKNAEIVDVYLEFTPAGEVDRSQLIDMALDTKDEAWFRELVSR